MSQAEMADTANPSAGSRQTIAGTCGRRALIAGAGLAAAALALPAVAAAEPDAAFWAKWRAWKQIDDAWLADTDDSDESRDRWNELHYPALAEMLAIPVTTSRALAAKWDAVEGESVDLLAAPWSTKAMFRQDIARIARQEKLA